MKVTNKCLLLPKCPFRSFDRLDRNMPSPPTQSESYQGQHQASSHGMTYYNHHQQSSQLMASNSGGSPGRQALQHMRLMMQARSPHSTSPNSGNNNHPNLSLNNSPYSSPQKVLPQKSLNAPTSSPHSSICYSPPSTPQRSHSSMSHHRSDATNYTSLQSCPTQYSSTAGAVRSLMGSPLTSSPISPYHQSQYQQPSAYASSSLKINRAERRQALDYASKTLPHNATMASGSSRLSQVSNENFIETAR